MILLDAKTETEIVTRIRHLKSSQEGVFKEFRSRAARRRERYYGDHYSDEQYAGQRKKGEERITLNAEMRLVDKAFGLLTIDPPVISARPEEETEPGLDEADRLEAWLEGVLYMQRMRQGLDPINHSMLDGLITGMGLWWVYWDDSLDTRTTGQLEQLPLVIKRRDPTKVLLREGGKTERWLWCMYTDEIPILDVELEWNVELEKYKSMKFEKKSEQTVEVTDFWGWDYAPGEDGNMKPTIINAVVAGTQLIKAPVPMPMYKYLPVVAWFCKPTPATEWERKALPIISTLEKTAPEVESMLNALMRATKLYAQLPLIYKGEGIKPDLPAEYGTYASIGPQDKLEFLTWPGNPPDMYRIYEMLQGEVDLGGLGAPLMGQTPASPSGYALSLRGEAGTLSLVAPQQSLSLALSEVLQKTCSLCASFAPDLEMRVFGKHQNQRKVFALKGEQMEGWFIDVEVNAQWPEDKDQKMAWGLQLAANPESPLDQRTIVEDFFGYPNADAIQQRKLIDTARKHPGLQLLELIQAMQRRGLDQYIPMVLGQGQGPGQGSPPAPGAPSMSVEGVPTQAMPQEELGAMGSDELGGRPGGAMTSDEEEMNIMRGGGIPRP